MTGDVVPLVSRSRERARDAAAAIRAAIVDPRTSGTRCPIHIHYGGKRRGTWLFTWTGLPGLTYDAKARAYTHALLPGWQYTVAELRTELVDDLDHFALTGEQPKVATNGSHQGSLRV